MKNKPLASVIMPVYNAEQYLREAIESILNQTYRNFEFIIIDDCSDDNSWKIIKKYAKKDKRIKPHKNRKNLKIAKTRNKGFDLMDKKSKYAAIFDADDISMPNRLEEGVKFLNNHSDYGIVGSHIHIIDENSELIGRRRYDVSNDQIKRKAILRSPFAQPTVMIRSKILKDVGYYNEKFTGIPCEDYDLWFRILSKYKGYNIDDYLLKYRISSTQSKTTHLKIVLKNTIKLQLKWVFKKDFFNILAIPYILLELFLLFLPSEFILWAFKKINFSS